MRSVHGRRRGVIAAVLGALAVLVALLAARHRPKGRRPPSPTPTGCCCSPPTACGRTSSSATPTTGGVPGFADLLRSGASADGGGMLTQAPPNTGAGWYTMATGAWPGVHGSTNNTFHLNNQAFGDAHGRVRPRRAVGRDHRPVRRAGRQEGRPDGVGRRPQRRHQRADRRLPRVPLRPRRDHQLRVAVRPAGADHRLRAAVRPGRRWRPRRPAGPTRPPRSARRSRPGCGCSTSASTSTGSTPTSTTAPTTAPTNYDRVLFARGKDGADAVADLRRRRVGRRQGHRAPTARSTGRPPACSSRSRR